MKKGLAILLLTAVLMAVTACTETFEKTAEITVTMVNDSSVEVRMGISGENINDDELRTLAGGQRTRTARLHYTYESGTTKEKQAEGKPDHPLVIFAVVGEKTYRYEVAPLYEKGESHTVTAHFDGEKFTVTVEKESTEE